MNFTFFSPVKIIFGAGTSKNISDYIPTILDAPQSKTPYISRCSLKTKEKSAKSKALIVTGKSTDRAEQIKHHLELAGISNASIVQSGEPCITDIINGVETARQYGIDVVIAIGGGSVIDTAKAVAALTTNKNDITDYLEVIGHGLPLTEQPIPMIAIPTTSGTGAEVTCNSVISSPDHKLKVSLRSNLMYPDIAVVDPELSISMSPEITATTGMDALTQLIEAFTSKFSNPLTDALCRDGISRVARSFKKVYSEPDNLDARSDMSIAAILSGIALANAKLGAVHGIAGPMGGMGNAAHGLLCASLILPVMSANMMTAKDITMTLSHNDKINQCGEDKSNENLELMNSVSLLKKYDEIACILTGNSKSQCNDAINYIDDLVRYTNINKIAFKSLPYLDESQVKELAQKSRESSSMKGNAVSLSLNQIVEIIQNTLKNR